MDIGAGDGALTSHLIAAGARVLAVELHPARVRRLRERFGDAVTVICADIAEVRLPGRPYRVVASPPYQHSSRVLRSLLGAGPETRQRESGP
jgi:23S rRNA (adenine-N6)-dimethyltransferase